MSISRGPVLRLALGFLTIILITAGAGWFAVSQIQGASRASVELAREQLPAAAAAVNVERLTLRAIATQAHHSESTWYLEKAAEAIEQALASLDTAASADLRDSARQTREALERYAEALAACEAGDGALSNAHEEAAKAFGAVELAAASARQQWESLPPDKRGGAQSFGLTTLWDVHDLLGASARFLARSAGFGQTSDIEEAMWQFQSASRLLQLGSSEAPDTADATETPAGDASGEASSPWPGVVNHLRDTARVFGKSIEGVRVAATRAAEAQTELSSAEDALWRQVQAFTRGGISGAEFLAHDVAGDLDSLSGAWWIALAMLLVTALATAIVSIASTSRSLEEANLPLLCSCGKLNAPTSRFCGRCGHEFT